MMCVRIAEPPCGKQSARRGWLYDDAYAGDASTVRPRRPIMMCPEVFRFFEERLARLSQLGVESASVMLDRVSFGKLVEHNLGPC